VRSPSPTSGSSTTTTSPKGAFASRLTAALRSVVEADCRQPRSSRYSALLGALVVRNLEVEGVRKPVAVARCRNVVTVPYSRPYFRMDPNVTILTEGRSRLKNAGAVVAAPRHRAGRSCSSAPTSYLLPPRRRAWCIHITICLLESSMAGGESRLRRVTHVGPGSAGGGRSVPPQAVSK
jgi:hypothetical protein